MKNAEIQWRRECAERVALRREARRKLHPNRYYPQAVSHPTRKDWRGLAATCALWAIGLAVGLFIVYTIATVPAGWWIPGGLPYAP